MINYQSLSDDELDTVRRDAVNEQERRANLATIPATIRDLRDKYVEGGGDPADLDLDTA